MACFITGKSFYAAAESAGLDCLQQGCKPSVLFPRKNNVVPFVKKRDEAQLILVGRRPQSERHVCCAGLDLPRTLGVCADIFRVTMNTCWRNAFCLQLAVEPQACPRSRIAVDEINVFPGQVRQGMDSFGVAGCGYKSL